MIKIEVRADNDPETLFGVIPLDSYGAFGNEITFELSGDPKWLGNSPPVPDKLTLDWDNFSPDGVTVYPALKAKPNEIDKLRRIKGFIEGGRA